MIGNAAFCPKTGAQLSERRHYDQRGRALRVPVEDAHVSAAELDGELTAGAVQSSRRALLTHFRRTHQCYRPEDAALYRQVALWLRRLKRTANGPRSADTIVWVALCARVGAAGHDAKWMLGHVELRCPRCHGRLKYEERGSGTVRASCGTNCTADAGDRLGEIEALATDLYARTFGSETPEPDVPEAATRAAALTGSCGGDSIESIIEGHPTDIERNQE